MEDPKTILSLFAHPDDELGCIGTLVNHVQRGDRVVMAWTTYGELTSKFEDKHPDEVKSIRRKHAEDIAKIVGAESIKFLDFGDMNVQNTKEERVKLAKFYAEIQPDAIISWGPNNSHSDHSNTSKLALEAIQFARIPKIVDMKPHRSSVKFLTYWEKQQNYPTKYIDVSEVMDTIIECANYYADIYGWKKVDMWIRKSRAAKGYESMVAFAEKFNVRFEYTPAPKYVV